MEEDAHVPPTQVSFCLLTFGTHRLVIQKVSFLRGSRFWHSFHLSLSRCPTHRSLVQIKSHAQKVLKRLDAGEDVFRRLEENLGIIDRLVVDAMKTQLSPAGLQEFNESCRRTASLYSKRKRPTKSSKKAEPQTVSPVNAAESGPVYEAGRGDAESGKESVIAAAALCQLSSIGGWESDKVGASPVEE